MNKKILIVSAKYDRPANKVIDWLIYQNKKFLRFYYEEESIKDVKIDIKRNNFEISFISKKGLKNNYLIKSSEISSVWYRNGGLMYQWDTKNNLIHPHLAKKVEKYYDDELTVLFDYLFHLLKNKTKLGDYKYRKQNKLINLALAKECKINIPETIIASKKKDVQNFNKSNNSIINKPLYEIFSACAEKYQYFNYVEETTSETINNIQETIFPQLFQNKIKKKYELRIFFMNNKFFSLAIFNNSKNVDWRSSSYEKIFVRHVPYNLPKNIIKKLTNFIKKANLSVGAIDMIVSKDNKYIFLEVNPLGQFAYHSLISNYFIEKEIAKLLI